MAHTFTSTGCFWRDIPTVLYANAHYIYSKWLLCAHLVTAAAYQRICVVWLDSKWSDDHFASTTYSVVPLLALFHWTAVAMSSTVSPNCHELSWIFLQKRMEFFKTKSEMPFLLFCDVKGWNNQRGTKRGAYGQRDLVSEYHWNMIGGWNCYARPLGLGRRNREGAVFLGGELASDGKRCLRGDRRSMPWAVFKY